MNEYIINKKKCCVVARSRVAVLTTTNELPKTIVILVIFITK